MKPRGFRPVAPQRLFPPTTNPNRSPGFPGFEPGDHPGKGRSPYNRPTTPMNRPYPHPSRPRGRSGVPHVPWKPIAGAAGRLNPWLAVLGALYVPELDDWWLFPDSPAEVGPAGWSLPAGWTQCPTPDCADVWGAPDYGVWGTPASCSSFPACPEGQAGGVAGTTRLPWGVLHATRLTLLGYKWTSGNPSDASFRGTVVSQHIRTGPGVTTVPEYVRGVVVLPEQFEDPLEYGYEPEISYPPRTGVVGSETTAPGWWPGWSPTGSPGAGPGAGPGTGPGAGPGAGPGSDPSGGPYVPPYVPPTVDFSPGGPPGGTPGHHFPTPPRPGDKEIKIKINWGAIGKLYGAATEFQDLLDCVEKSVGLQKPKPWEDQSPQGRFMRLYRHMNDPKNSPPDGNEFTKCMVLAQAQDMAIGKLSNAFAKSVNRSPYSSGRPGGYRGGGYGTRMH